LNLIYGNHVAKKIFNTGRANEMQMIFAKDVRSKIEM